MERIAIVFYDLHGLFYLPVSFGRLGQTHPVYSMSIINWVAELIKSPLFVIGTNKAGAGGADFRVGLGGRSQEPEPERSRSQQEQGRSRSRSGTRRDL
ncbi:hypothetical protein AVEN_154526-1 [Araneus ventricosus]|uniref:Uncharacterized protein n=1 Tax=Araneus ventricosus TaxID=182803 RepID=A0A4Y2HWJ0_ARAVE|nr:hypothetical protein AVEN_154526-1 [Araneus ventricosus]